MPSEEDLVTAASEKSSIQKGRILMNEQESTPGAHPAALTKSQSRRSTVLLYENKFFIPLVSAMKGIVTACQCGFVVRRGKQGDGRELREIYAFEDRFG